ncbi:hypothetical protein [Marinobacterium arenosum]|uniref:hypothetical protein n=1 Tax=Marinobacterium arenosum TaxID=2862496 RepID=UPI001C9773E7|nr:hypothetical protein [Marinobacterium arenosum]MBY4676932.1 hypothetical protein [Marinobacterium arenosum]
MTDMLDDETVLEIVQLENGDLALRRADDDSGELLLRVGASQALRESMQGEYLNIARVMLTAGVQLMAEAGFIAETEAELPQPTIH